MHCSCSIPRHENTISNSMESSNHSCSVGLYYNLRSRCISWNAFLLLMILMLFFFYYYKVPYFNAYLFTVFTKGEWKWEKWIPYTLMLDHAKEQFSQHICIFICFPNSDWYLYSWFGLSSWREQHPSYPWAMPLRIIIICGIVALHQNSYLSIFKFT